MFECRNGETFQPPDPMFSKSSLSLGNIDLDAVCSLRGWVLPERGCPLGGHEPPTGLLPVPVWEVQGFLPRYHTLLSNSLLWYGSWWLWEEERIIKGCLYKFAQLVGFWFYQNPSTKYLKLRTQLFLMPIWDQYQDSPFTFFSGLSTGLQLLFLICCSWSNFMVTSSMESCSRSQNPARSWEVGRGMALGSCEGRRQEELQQS